MGSFLVIKGDCQILPITEDKKMSIPTEEEELQKRKEEKRRRLEEIDVELSDLSSKEGKLLRERGELIEELEGIDRALKQPSLL